METMNNKNHIVLGILSQKPMIFKVMDTLAMDTGFPETVFGKTTSKLLSCDPLDYLKAQYKLRAESVTSSSTDIDTKNVKKSLKRKLYPVKTKLLGGKSECVRYLSPLVDPQFGKVQCEDLLKWFSEKVIARKYLSAKRTLLQEFRTEASAVYVSPVFYKSRTSVTFDRNKIQFQLYLKEWFNMELSPRLVNSITVYSKHPLIKLSVRTRIVDEMSKLYSKYKLRGFDIYKCSPKKTTGLKDALLLFTDQQLSRAEFEQLVSIYGTDRLLWNESDTDGKEMLENTLHKNSHLTEIVSNKVSIKWSVIFKSKPRENISNKNTPTDAVKCPTDENVLQDSKPNENNVHNMAKEMTPKDNVSIANSETNTQSVRPMESVVNVMSKEMTPKEVISQNSLVVTIGNTSNNVKQKERIVSKTKKGTTPKDVQTQSFRVVTVANMTPPPDSATNTQHSKSKDGRANKRSKEITSKEVIAQNSLVVTISNNSQTPASVVNTKTTKRKERTLSKTRTETTVKEEMTQDSRVVTVASDQQPTTNPIKMEPLTGFFNKGRYDPPTAVANGPNQLASEGVSTFMANGARPAQAVITLPLIMKIESTTATVNNVPKPVQSSNLMYIPNRNLSNVFETFHYNPSADCDVRVHGVDLLCLNFGQYLNDNIINFYLNFIRFEIMTEEQRKRTHLFNVFFNTKLTQGRAGSAARDSPATRHARVAKWTKKTDIFDKDFIIIPLNENQHWFLAIVCFPWMAGMISYDQLFDGNKDHSEIPVNKTPFASKHRVERVKRLREQYGVEPSPCILLFDSTQTRSRAPNVKVIREYLKTEWDSKRSATDGPLVFDKNTVRGFNPQVPQQANNIDCGIFVLHYVEKFFQQPLKVFTKEYFRSSLLKWFDNETVARKRAAIQNMVLAKADEYAHSGTARNSSKMSSGTNESGPDIQIF